MTEQAIHYGDALYELAVSENLSREIFSDLQGISGIFGELPDYLNLLSEPSLPKAERCALLDSAFRGKVHPYTLNFLKILTEKGLIRLFWDCALRFRGRHFEELGITEVRVHSAAPLSDVQKKELTKRLQSMTGKKISLLPETDPSLLGGIRITVGNREYDYTVRGRLRELSAKVKETTIN